MAESAVSIVIDKLTPLLTHEVKLLKGIHKEVEDIKDELRSIKCFLRDADARAEKEDIDEGVKDWVKQVREVAYRIEDVIDEYMLHVAQRREQRGCKAFLHRIARLVKKLKPRHEIASEIQDIKASVRGIKERRERYGFSPSEQGGSSSAARISTRQDPRVGSLFIDEAELVGIESPRHELVSKLVDGVSKRTVVSVVGMGGIGKTTLAKKVYDDVKAHFDCHAWITVSQSYNIEELLRSIIRQFLQLRMEATPPEIDTMNIMLLISKLIELLQQKRYVVVFDDVWKVDFWGEIEYALLDNNNGSRIIITTRIRDVADFCKKSAYLHVHEQQLLPFEMAWELFCRKAFRFEQDGHCPPELKELSSDIVQRCGGLPLAIVAIGGLMSIKGSDVSEWRNLLDSLSLELESNPHLTSVKRILTFSYHDLPYHLKSCFLYFGMFPEDYSIHCSRLIRLWIANGFIKERQGVTLEAMAEKYLTELIHRSLVQVAKFKLDGKVKRCQVHDLLREVILSKSEELSFNHVSVENYSGLNGIARHLSICHKVNNISETVSRFQTRSIMIFNIDELSNQVIRPLFVNFKLLNVLDFEKAPLDYIPEELGNRLCLSYLSIRKTKVKALPKSIGKLLNLETLDLRQSFVDELPVEINRFPNLRYLLVNFFNYDIEYNINSRHGIKIQGSVGCLKALQKLYSLDIQHASMKSISELGNLTQLRKLGIKKLKKENGIALCKALEKMTHLESLAVSSTSEMEFLEFQSISSPPLLLQCLRLDGRLEKLPDWIQKLKGLVSIDMRWSRLMDDPLNVLEALPNLLELVLYDGYDGDQLRFEKGRFQKLKRLCLQRLSRLNKLVIDQGTLPLLEELIIGPSPQLKEVPSGIQHLRNLNLLQFDDMSKEFAVSVVPHQGPDHSKVEHIPSVHFRYTTQGARMIHYYLDDSDLLEFLQS